MNMADRIDGLRPQLRIILPPAEELEKVSVLDQACTRSAEDLALLTSPQEAKKNLFIKTALGEMRLSALPETSPSVPILVSLMAEMRDVSAASDTELHGGIYHGESGYFVLEHPSFGGFNYTDHYYYAGPTPIIDGYTLAVDIHSHPPGLKFEREAPQEARAGKNLPSQNDFGQLLYLTKIPQEHHIQSVIVVGQEIATLITRTKETAPKRPGIISDRHWEFADILNKLLGIDTEIKEKHPQLSPLSRRLLAIGQTCQKYRLGWYLTRLRKTGSPEGFWTRFNPWPKDLDKAIDVLLG